MADWLPFYRSWAEEWKRSWEEAFSTTSAAAASLGLPTPGTIPGDPFVMMVSAARSWLIGKKRAFRFRDQDVTLFLTDIAVEGPEIARAVGQYGQVTIAARDVGWGDHQLERLAVRARNVHVRPGTRPMLMAAPVLCEALVSASTVSRWLATRAPRLSLTLRAGVTEIAVAGAPWARVEVEPAAQGRSIRIQPRALHLRNRRLPLRFPPLHVSLPVLRGGIMLTSIEPAPEGFVLRWEVTEWQRSLSRDDVERLLTAMRGGKDRLDI